MARDRFNADDEVCRKRRDEGRVDTNITKQTILSEMKSRRSQRSTVLPYSAMSLFITKQTVLPYSAMSPFTAKHSFAVQCNVAVHNEAGSFAVQCNSPFITKQTVSPCSAIRRS